MPATQQAPISAKELSALGEVAVETADRVVTTTVQDMHRAIADRVFTAVGPSGALVRAVHDAIASGVYGAIRNAGTALSRCACAAAPVVQPVEGRSLAASPRASLALAALNGLIGDTLAERGSEVRIELALRRQGEDLPVEADALSSAYPDASGKLVLFVHGLMETDDSWRLGERAAGGSYGSRLEAELGYTALHLRYNTGLHVSENGRRLSELLEALIASWPVAVEEIVLIGHSMGGLVSRSACHHAGTNRFAWAGAVRHLICLGTPHTGAPMEKTVNVAAGLLGAVPESRPFADVLNTRSPGIKDLRFGYICEDDWRDHDPDALLRNTRTEVPLAEGVAHHFVAATLSAHPRHPLGEIAGDLLVRMASASGRCFVLRHEDVRHFGGLNHFHLLNHPRVYEQIRAWLEPG